MPILFYISSLVAIIATIMVITRYQPIHALLYLVVSFMAVALIFLSLGAPFMAVLEIIVYAGAIIVLFIFVVMMLNLGRETAIQEKQWLQPKVWAGPSLLALVLLAQLVILLTKETAVNMNVQPVEIKQISLSLYRKYILALELTGFLLMAGIVGAAHIGKHKKKHLHRFLQEDQAGQKSIDESTEVPMLSNEEKAAETVL